MTVKVNQKAIDDIKKSREMRLSLLEAGQQIAEVAAQLAPVRDVGSRGGAKSIRADLVVVNGMPEVHVSWDRDHFYMGFIEFGAEGRNPEPFLRPAAQRFM
jgi:HK97 gp10 family phage protein